ncbi:hypothetical protein EVJ58_g268 [Rhodofomes roseus]|uniref:HAT C-terminal dimerisation domain-containing protein n=1 Tax=Rhodofomes roseus TaxID=34475 RepID=A0A4Y9Z4B7_9APHY|nr:hypothetical protein EVJ58_g268 [Rhodofomes roseus]
MTTNPSMDDWDKELRSLMEDFNFNKEQPDAGNDVVEGLWDVNEDINKESRADMQKKVRPVKMTLLKLRKFSMVIHHLPRLLLLAWKRAIEAVELKFKKLLQDVRTQWNSTFRMLAVALQYRKAIKQMTEIFNDATQYFLHEVVIDGLLGKPNGYAEVLDPCYKLWYFADNGRLPLWINDAQFALQRAYDKDWKGQSSGMLAHNAEPTTSTPVCAGKAAAPAQKVNIFDAARAKCKLAAMPTVVDELDHYLAAEPDPTIDNALKWWTSSTSVGVERLFSKGCIIVTHPQNGLSAVSICMLMCLNNWSPLGLVKDTDVLNVTTEDPLKDAAEDPEAVWGNDACDHL